MKKSVVQIPLRYRFDDVSIPMNRAAIEQAERRGPAPAQDFSSPLTHGQTEIINPTEMGETLKELNSDTVDPTTRQSAIDMKSRLHPIELSAVLCVDVLVGLGVLPTKCLILSRQKKRLAVSLQGLGRKEVVDIVNGKREQDAKMGNQGLADRMKGAWNGK